MTLDEIFEILVDKWDQGLEVKSIRLTPDEYDNIRKGLRDPVNIRLDTGLGFSGNERQIGTLFGIPLIIDREA